MAIYGTASMIEGDRTVKALPRKTTTRQPYSTIGTIGSALRGTSSPSRPLSDVPTQKPMPQYQMMGGGGGGGAGSAATNAVNASLAKATEAAVRQNIAMLEAELGLSVEEIIAQGGNMAAQAQLLISQLNEAQGMAIRQSNNALAERGMFRSGITATKQGEILKQYADQRAMAAQSVGREGLGMANDLARAVSGYEAGVGKQISSKDLDNLQTELSQIGTGRLEQDDVFKRLSDIFAGGKQVDFKRIRDFLNTL